MSWFKTFGAFILFLFVFNPSNVFSQQQDPARVALVKAYKANFERLNTPNSCPIGSGKIRKSFLKRAGKDVLVAAHRGDHMEAPENSILSFQHAVLYGTAIVELDVRNSSDDSLMVIHDGTIDRTTTGMGHVEKMSYATLRAENLLDDYTGTATEWVIPTLYEVLIQLRGKAMVDLDIKCDKIEEIYATVKRLDMMKEVIFFCDESDMDYVLAQDPKALVMPRARNMQELEHLMHKYKPNIVHIDDRNFDIPVAVKLVRSINPKCRVWANALGERDVQAIYGEDNGILELVELGIDVIQTDLPRYVGSLVCY